MNKKLTVVCGKEYRYSDYNGGYSKRVEVSAEVTAGFILRVGIKIKDIHIRLGEDRWHVLEREFVHIPLRKVEKWLKENAPVWSTRKWQACLKEVRRRQWNELWG